LRQKTGEHPSNSRSIRSPLIETEIASAASRSDHRDHRLNAEARRTLGLRTFAGKAASMNARITRRFLPAVFAVGVLGIAAPTASAEETLAASCEPPREFASSGWDYGAQGFTPQLSGPLTRAEVDIHKGAPNAGYLVEIRTVDGLGIPTDTVLATATVANASVPVGDSLISASFPNPAPVAASQEYALVVYLGGDVEGGVGYRTGDPCSGGIAFSEVAGPWDDFLTLDMVFRVFVTPPAPTPTPPAPLATPLPPTGQRAAAIKKCTRKFPGKAKAKKRKKCKKKANLLPV
jgi:hypothetical protein